MQLLKVPMPAYGGGKGRPWRSISAGKRTLTSRPEVLEAIRYDALRPSSRKRCKHVKAAVTTERERDNVEKQTQYYSKVYL